MTTQEVMTLSERQREEFDQRVRASDVGAAGAKRPPAPCSDAWVSKKRAKRKASVALPVPWGPVISNPWGRRFA